MGTAADPCFPAGSLAEDEDHWVRVQKSVTVQEGLCVSVPCTVTYRRYYWTDSTPAHGKGHMNYRIHQWPQTTQIVKCKTKPRADSTSLGTPGTITAPWTSEMHREGTQGHTSLGWREGIMKYIVTNRTSFLYM